MERDEYASSTGDGIGRGFRSELDEEFAESLKISKFIADDCGELQMLSLPYPVEQGDSHPDPSLRLLRYVFGVRAYVSRSKWKLGVDGHERSQEQELVDDDDGEYGSVKSIGRFSLSSLLESLS